MILTTDDWKFYPGNIVISNYTDIDGIRKQGIFCVVYLEMLDPSVICANNVVALKVTTQYNEKYSSYYCELEQNEANLKNKSRICCSKPYLFKHTDFTKLVGELSKEKLSEVRDKLKRFYDNSLKQIDYELDFVKKEV